MIRTLSVFAATALAFVSVAPGAGAAAPAGGYDEAWSTTLGGWNRHSSPVIADIDDDGANEVVFGHQDGFVRAYEGNGTPKWTVPAVPGVGPGCRAQSTGSAVDSSPTVADVDGDGRSEVIVGVGSNFVPDQNGSIVVFDGATGAREWGFSGGRDLQDIWTGVPSPDGWCEGVFTTPAIGDVNGDGNPDIVFASWDFYIWAVDGSGTPLPGFPITNDDTVWSSPALYDVDADGRDEIFIGGDSTLGGLFDHQGGVLRALDWTPSGVNHLWHRTANEVYHSSPAIGDVNGDGRLDIVVGTGDNWHATCGACASDHARLFAYDALDGTTLPGFPVSTAGMMIASPALGDVDADGQLEIVLGSGDHSVRAWNGDGSSAWSTTPSFLHLGTGPALGAPIIADLDGDGDQDVAVGTALGLALLDGRNGASLEAGLTWPDRANFAWSHESAPAVGVLEGERRLVVAGFNTPRYETRVAAYRLPSSSATDHWPMFRHSADRTGRSHQLPTQLCGPDTARPFCDVPAGAFYESSVSWMVATGITSGISSTHYGPDLSLTRAQMVTFLWRQAGAPTGYPAHDFVDVAPGAYFEAAVAWAKAEGVTTGTGPRTFSPDDTVTRGQLVTLMWRRVGAPGGQPGHGFLDVPPGSFYGDAVAWANANAITSGTGPTTFAPENAVTRAQAAALLHREAGSPTA